MNDSALNRCGCPLSREVLIGSLHGPRVPVETATDAEIDALIDVPAGEPVRLSTARYIHRSEAGLPADERTQRVGAAVVDPARFHVCMREADDAIHAEQEREPIKPAWLAVFAVLMLLSAIASLIVLRWGVTLFSA